MTHFEAMFNHPYQMQMSKIKKAKREEYLPIKTILNKPFRGAHLHHITRNLGIYIPAKIHRSVHHNIWTGKNMNEINGLALEWWFYEILGGSIKDFKSPPPKTFH